MLLILNIPRHKWEHNTHFTVLHLSFSSRYKFIIILQMHNCQHMSNNQYCLQHVDKCHVIFFSAKYIKMVRFVTILVEMKSKLNYILITSFKSLGITSSSLSISRFKIMLLRPQIFIYSKADKNPLILKNSCFNILLQTPSLFKTVIEAIQPHHG